MSAGQENAMWECIRNLKVCEFELSDGISGRLEREWLLGRLVARRGVRGAAYRDESSDRLVVEYDADRLSGADFVDFFSLCGVRATPARLGRAADRSGAGERPIVRAL